MSRLMSDRASIENPFPPAAEADWLRRVDAVLKGADFKKKLVSRSADGIAIQPLYAARDNATAVHGARPGERWRVAARVDHPDAEAAATQARDDLEGGADMLNLVFAGAPSARGYGLTCETITDLDEALAGVHLDLIKLRIDPAPAGRLNALLLAALIEKRKLDPAQVSIDFGMDPLATLTTLGHVPWDWVAMGERLFETATALKARGFQGPFLTIDLRPYHEAGATEGQELAIALAQGVFYLRALEARGMALPEAFAAVSFVVPVDGDQFLGIAKLRAFRKLWEKVALWSGVTPQPATIHAETSWRMLTRTDAHVNILRNTMAAFVAGLSGADSVTVLPFTQALGLPDAPARRLARNTSIVLQEEASLWRVIDPAAGAGGYETLTDDLAAKAWSLFQDIENEGGVFISLIMGKLQARIASAKTERLNAIVTRKLPITGTSEFANPGETPPGVLAVKPVKPKIPKARARAKIGPDTEDVIKAFLSGASRGDAAPLAEGETRIEPLASHRPSEAFEALRDRAETLHKKHKKPPTVVLATLGPLSDHGPRLAFMRNAFAAGEINVEVVADAAAVDGRLVCLVGSDAAYAADAARLTRKLKSKDRHVWLAGKPRDQEDTLKKAGVKRFVFMGSNIVEMLTAALDWLEEK
jgi:methylmalonyl-CoA mutase